MKNVVTNQEDFFNINALDKKVFDRHEIFSEYINKEQREGLKWLEDSKKILEYGCGTGTSIDVFSEINGLEGHEIVGVDIAENAISKVKERYPKFTFYKIANNKMPEIESGSLDGAYMFHVLHHSRDHEGIFGEIARVLKPGGKFLINDLTSRNPIVRLGRSLFGYTGTGVWKKFGDDLVVEGKIPEKYKLDTALIERQLRNVGFKIERKHHGHLFFFIFSWIDKFIKLTNFKPVLILYKQLTNLEGKMIRYTVFSRFAEVICFECKKNA